MQHTYKDASKLFFTSDTHWHHEPIIGFCKRPFKSVEEMDKVLIENWNNIVPKDGIVFHLGDFAWGNNWNIRNELNGEIILVTGNHDFKNHPPQATFQKMFKSIQQQLYLKIEGKKVYLNHYPFLCYGGTYRNTKDLVWQLHGHTHFGPTSNGKDDDRLKLCFPTQYDVGVDNNDFRPISWREVTEIISKQIDENVNYQNINKINIEKACQILS